MTATAQAKTHSPMRYWGPRPKVRRFTRVYTFDQLEPRAQDNVRDHFATSYGFFMADDYLASLTRFVDFFGAELRDYDIDWFEPNRSNIEIDVPDISRRDLLALIRDLRTKTDGKCPFTGICSDCPLIEGALASYAGGERDLREIIMAGYHKWIWEANSIAEYDLSDEGLKDTCDTNEYRFNAQGRLVR